MERVTVKVAVIGENNMVDEGQSKEVTRDSSTVETALSWAMNDAEVWMLEALTRGNHAFDLTVTL